MACLGCGYSAQPAKCIPAGTTTANTTATAATTAVTSAAAVRFVYLENWVYSFEAEAMLVALRRGRTSSLCRPHVCVHLRSSLSAGSPAMLLCTLLKKPGALGRLGYHGLQQELEAADYLASPPREQHDLLRRLGVTHYHGDGTSGIVSFFCDGSGPSCCACQVSMTTGFRGKLLFA